MVGVAVSLVFFINKPSWPTPDKLLLFLTFVFMCFGQAWEMLKRFVPFVGLLLVYESFRGLIPSFNGRVNFTWMPDMDKKIFGALPTHKLQEWWWNGRLAWYDYLFYIVYMLHFVLPVGLAVLVWKKRAKDYWQFISTYVVLSFAGFITYLAFPAAPPWLASDTGVIAPINHLAGNIWVSLGINDFKLAYGKINPNPVAAVPSLHAAYAVLFSMFIFKFFGKKWGMASLIYPILIFLGTTYLGEHYVIDLIIGAAYAFGAYYLTQWIFNAKPYNKFPFIKELRKRFNKLKNRA